MELLREFVNDIRDYLKEILLCGVGALNRSDEERFMELEGRAISLGLSYGSVILRGIRENIYNAKEVAFLLSKLLEYVKIMNFKMM
ncbi:MAG: hypothetical protein ACRC7N_05850 [Clostridium sp.]